MTDQVGTPESKEPCFMIQDVSNVVGGMVKASYQCLKVPQEEDAEKVAGPSTTEHANRSRSDSSATSTIQKGQSTDDVPSIGNVADHTAAPGKSGTVDKNGRTHYFSSRLVVQRRKVVWRFCFTVITFAILIFTVFTLFWGSNAYTTRYYHRVKLLAVIQDDVYTPEMETVGIASLSTALEQIIPTVPGKWSIYNTISFNAKFNTSTPAEIDAKITERIYHEYYWVSINVRPNATAHLFQSIVNVSAPMFNSTDVFQSVYESGRDPTNMMSSIFPLMQQLEAKFAQYYVSTYLPSLLHNITAARPNTTAININMENIASSGRMSFGYIDHRPFTRRGLVTPTQVGLIDGLLLTVFQFLIYTPLHMEMAQLLNRKNFMVYRLAITVVTFFFISLFYCAVAAIFNYDFTVAFGRGGFMVYWMSTWLYMVACGGANENVVTLIVLHKPEYMGFWMMIFVALNLGPSFFPLVLNNVVYRYGYMMPIHNAMDLFKVIFLNTSRRHMGRNYGVLLAWIAVNTAIFPFVICWVDRVNKRRQAEAEAAAAAPTSLVLRDVATEKD